MIERGAVLEEEHRPTFAWNPVWRGCCHAFFID
jgi:hypothetical protein